MLIFADHQPATLRATQSSYTDRGQRTAPPLPAPSLMPWGNSPSATLRSIDRVEILSSSANWRFGK